MACEISVLVSLHNNVFWVGLVSAYRKLFPSLISIMLQRMFKKAKEISDDKVNIAVNTYELVDKHIRKLDSDLAKFESEMKVRIEYFYNDISMEF